MASEPTRLSGGQAPAVARFSGQRGIDPRAAPSPGGKARSRERSPASPSRRVSEMTKDEELPPRELVVPALRAGAKPAALQPWSSVKRLVPFRGGPPDQ